MVSRFDLASALARELHAVDKLGAFFRHHPWDPVISQVKAHPPSPWDLGEGATGGQLPVGLDGMERQHRTGRCAPSGRGTGARIGELASRLTGSSDLYTATAAAFPPPASISSPPTTASPPRPGVLQRQAQRGQRRGTATTATTTTSPGTAGAEGETDADTIKILRARQKRNLLATLLLSQGVPMLCAEG